MSHATTSLQASVDGSVAYQVSREPLAPGTRLKRYHMHDHADLIAHAQKSIELGNEALLAELSGGLLTERNIARRASALPSSQLRMMIVLEALFEHVRLRLCPATPSRLDSIFVWPTLAAARQFQGDYLQNGTIHVCSIVNGPCTIKDGSLLPPGINIARADLTTLRVELARTRERAETYWRAETPMELPELMVGGIVTVLAVVSKPAP